MSLRTKIVLPLVALSIVFTILGTLFVLDSLETDLAGALSANIHSSFAVFVAQRSDDTSETRAVRQEHRDDPQILILYFDSGGDRVRIDSASSKTLITTHPEHTGEIPPPVTFLAQSYVGILFDSLEPGVRPDGYASIGVLAGTRDFQSTYEGTRTRLILQSVVLIVSIMVIGLLIARQIEKRIDILRHQIKEGGTSKVIPSLKGSTDNFDVLGADILKAQESIQASEKEIARLQVVRSRFLANVSHEVRTPLFSLKGFLETLLDGGVDDPQVKRPFLKKALHHAQRIDNLLRDLIDITRIESGEMRMSFRYFLLSDLASQLVQDHADMAHGRNQTFAVSGDFDALEVIGDKDRLRQALSNLIENAIKYSPEDTSVTLLIEPGKADVRFSVIDNGSGIGHDHIERIFERFYRIDPDRSRAQGGTGLGLAIVKHIVEAHGSRVDVISKIGKGTTFSFSVRRS